MTLEQKLNEHFENGRDLGREEGRDQERKETITSMIKNGFNEEQIMSVFKTITVEDIAVIRRQMAQASQ